MPRIMAAVGIIQRRLRTLALRHSSIICRLFMKTFYGDWFEMCVLMGFWDGSLFPVLLALGLER